MSRIRFALAVTAAVAASGTAWAQAFPATEANMRQWGVATLPEIDALGSKLLPFYMPGEGLTPVDTSKCAQAVPLLIEFQHKTLVAATLLQKMSEHLVKIERVSALASLQGEIARLRDWGALALVDEGRCLAKGGDRAEAGVRFAQAIDLSTAGDGGRQALNEIAKLLEYAN